MASEQASGARRQVITRSPTITPLTSRTLSAPLVSTGSVFSNETSAAHIQVSDFTPTSSSSSSLGLTPESTHSHPQGITNSLWALSQLFTECSMPPVPTSLVSMAVFR